MYYKQPINMYFLSTYNVQHCPRAQERRKVKMKHFKHRSSLSAVYVIIFVNSYQLASDNVLEIHSLMNSQKQLRLNISFFPHPSCIHENLHSYFSKRMPSYNNLDTMPLPFIQPISCLVLSFLAQPWQLIKPVFPFSLLLLCSWFDQLTT